MISRLRGIPAGRTVDGLVVDVGGVGYLVSATPSVLRRADGASEVTVETYLHVREDALQLYGFADASERALFAQLLGVSGIGPKVALAVVSSASPDELQRAIALKDSARFQAIPASARRPPSGSCSSSRAPCSRRRRSPSRACRGELTARDALVELGYSLVEAEQALATVDVALPVEERVREALRSAA